LLHALRQLKDFTVDELLEHRYGKYRKIGAFVEGQGDAGANGQLEA
jgi:acetyl-CoA carboxylase alpha subunit